MAPRWRGAARATVAARFEELDDFNDDLQFLSFVTRLFVVPLIKLQVAFEVGLAARVVHRARAEKDEPSVALVVPLDIEEHPEVGPELSRRILGGTVSRSDGAVNDGVHLMVAEPGIDCPVVAQVKLGVGRREDRVVARQVLAQVPPDEAASAGQSTATSLGTAAPRSIERAVIHD